MLISHQQKDIFMFIKVYKLILSLPLIFITFQIISRIDEMAGRIDDLEHNINDLMVTAGQGEGTPAIASEHQK